MKSYHRLLGSWRRLLAHIRMRFQAALHKVRYANSIIQIKKYTYALFLFEFLVKSITN